VIGTHSRIESGPRARAPVGGDSGLTAAGYRAGNPAPDSSEPGRSPPVGAGADRAGTASHRLPVPAYVTTRPPTGYTGSVQSTGGRPASSSRRLISEKHRQPRKCRAESGEG
jgi:hypothetical protein